jgi:hypothetical protein
MLQLAREPGVAPAQRFALHGSRSDGHTARLGFFEAHGGWRGGHAGREPRELAHDPASGADANCERIGI